VIDRHLVCHVRILGIDAQNGAVGDHAILAVVHTAGGNYDHLALRFGQPGIAQHERVVISEEGAKLVGAMRQREEHVRNEAGFVLNREHLVADVLREIFERRHGVAAD
jgi:hypothetical protein